MLDPKRKFFDFSTLEASHSLSHSAKVKQTRKRIPILIFFFWPTYFIHLSDITVRCCGLYYKPTISVNDDSRVVNKLETSLSDDAGVVIYDCNVFIKQ